MQLVRALYMTGSPRSRMAGSPQPTSVLSVDCLPFLKVATQLYTVLLPAAWSPQTARKRQDVEAQCSATVVRGWSQEASKALAKMNRCQGRVRGEECHIINGQALHLFL